MFNIFNTDVNIDIGIQKKGGASCRIIIDSTRLGLLASIRLTDLLSSSSKVNRCWVCVCDDISPKMLTPLWWSHRKKQVLARQDTIIRIAFEREYYPGKMISPRTRNRISSALKQALALGLVPELVLVLVLELVQHVRPHLEGPLDLQAPRSKSGSGRVVAARSATCQETL